jgi:hypothetical protein
LKVAEGRVPWILGSFPESREKLCSFLAGSPSWMASLLSGSEMEFPLKMSLKLVM